MTKREGQADWSPFLRVSPKHGDDGVTQETGIRPVTAREAAEKVRGYLRDNFDLHGAFEVRPLYAGMSGHDVVRTAEGDGYIDGTIQVELTCTPKGRPHAAYTAVIPVPVRRGHIHRPSTIYPRGYEPLLCGQAAFDALARADVGEGAWARNTRTASTREAAYPGEQQLGGWLDIEEEIQDARRSATGPLSVVVTVQAVSGSGSPLSPAETITVPAATPRALPRALTQALDDALNRVEVDASDVRVTFVEQEGTPAIRVSTGPAQGIRETLPHSPLGMGGLGDTYVGAAEIMIQFVGDALRGAGLDTDALQELYRSVVEPMLMAEVVGSRQAAVEARLMPVDVAARDVDKLAGHLSTLTQHGVAQVLTKAAGVGAGVSAGVGTGVGAGVGAGVRWPTKRQSHYYFASVKRWRERYAVD